MAVTLLAPRRVAPVAARAAAAVRAPLPVSRAFAGGRVVRPVPAWALRAIEEESAASSSSAAEDAAPEGPNPWEILKVSRGTSYQGLIVARQQALEQAGDDTDAIELVDWAFNKFVDGSRQHFQKSLDEDPENPDHMFALGNYEQTLENFELAAEWYRKALAAADNKHIDSLNQLAMIEQQVNKDEDAAEALYLQALEIDPSDVDILFNVAMLRLGQKKLEGVREMVERIVVIKPELKDHPLVKELADI